MLSARFCWEARGAGERARGRGRQIGGGLGARRRAAARARPERALAARKTRLPHHREPNQADGRLALARHAAEAARGGVRDAYHHTRSFEASWEEARAKRAVDGLYRNSRRAGGWVWRRERRAHLTAWLEGEEAAATLSEGRRAARRVVEDAFPKAWATRSAARTARGACGAAGAAAGLVLERRAAFIGTSSRQWDWEIACDRQIY
jgi:hypothetical protein